jgi:lipopolysaccharide export system protein LptA
MPPNTLLPSTCPARLTTLLRGLMAVATLAACLSVQAEKADREKPMVVEADRPGTVDMQRKVVVFNGNVVIVQGTMRIAAERVEVRELGDGKRTAVATGAPARQATFRQKRDGVDETIEAVADRIEYDGATDALRFVGQATVRRMRGTQKADEIFGQTITWNNATEVFRVEGGAVTPDNPSGRVRAILSPTPSAGGGAGR